jgi:recombination protein RecA
MARTKLVLGREEELPEVKDKYEEGEYTVDDLLSTGSTLLNLALSDYVQGGWAKGSICNVVGDSSAGKTMLLMNTYAEILYSTDRNEYNLYYDEPEQALRINVEKLFGERVEEITWMEEDSSFTIEDFRAEVINRAKENTSMVYGLDSFDALSSKQEVKKAEAQIEGTSKKGSYGMDKAQISGVVLRMILKHIRNTNSLLVVISQTRDKINAMFGSQKTRSGGHALRFYSTHEIWMHVIRPIKRREREVGVQVRVRVKKNKLTGKLREVEFPIYYDYGIDDIGSMVDFLVIEGFWEQKRKEKKKVLDNVKIDTGSDFPAASRPVLIDHIEKTKPESVGKLKDIVQEAWNEIEAEIATKRPPRYGE